MTRLVLPTILACACTPHLTSPAGNLDTAPWVAPENTWSTATPPDDLVGEGFSEGQVPPDFRMTDQLGDTVALWQFWGQVVVVDISTMWCAQCRTLAAGVDETWLAYRDQGFMYLTVLAQDLEHAVPDVDDLVEWAEYYDITAPVLSDDEGWSASAVPDGVYPRVLVLDRELRVAVANVVPAEDAAIRAAVEALLE